MKVRDLLRLLREDGWFVVAEKGGVHSLQHGQKPGKMTIAGDPFDVDVPPRFFGSVLHRAGIEWREEKARSANSPLS